MQGFDPSDFKLKTTDHTSNALLNKTSHKRQKQCHTPQTYQKLDDSERDLEAKTSELYDYKERMNLLLRLLTPMYYKKSGMTFDHRLKECDCPDNTHKLRELDIEYDPNHTYDKSEVDFSILKNRNIMTYHIVKLYKQGGLQALEDQDLRPIDYKKVNYTNIFKKRQEDHTDNTRTTTSPTRRFRYNENERAALGQLGLIPTVPMTIKDAKRYKSQATLDTPSPGKQEKASLEYQTFMDDLREARKNPDFDMENSKPEKTQNKATPDTFSSQEKNKPIDYSTLFSRGIEPPGFILNYSTKPHRRNKKKSTTPLYIHKFTTKPNTFRKKT
jgi:hypothetical protein